MHNYGIDDVSKVLKTSKYHVKTRTYRARKWSRELTNLLGGAVRSNFLCFFIAKIALDFSVKQANSFESLEFDNLKDVRTTYPLLCFSCCPTAVRGQFVWCSLASLTSVSPVSPLTGWQGEGWGGGRGVGWRGEGWGGGRGVGWRGEGWGGGRGVGWQGEGWGGGERGGVAGRGVAGRGVGCREAVGKSEQQRGWERAISSLHAEPDANKSDPNSQHHSVKQTSNTDNRISKCDIDTKCKFTQDVIHPKNII